MTKGGGRKKGIEKDGKGKNASGVRVGGSSATQIDFSNLGPLAIFSVSCVKRTNT